MNGQLQIDFVNILHKRENNADSERHLKENYFRFTGQCAIVLSLLQKGIRLSTLTALRDWHIGDLRRRIKDLKDSGIQIKEEFIKDSQGKRTRYKEWFI